MNTGQKILNAIDRALSAPPETPLQAAFTRLGITPPAGSLERIRDAAHRLSHVIEHIASRGSDVSRAKFLESLRNYEKALTRGETPAPLTGWQSFLEASDLELEAAKSARGKLWSELRALAAPVAEQFIAALEAEATRVDSKHHEDAHTHALPAEPSKVGERLRAMAAEVRLHLKVGTNPAAMLPFLDFNTNS